MSVGYLIPASKYRESDTVQNSRAVTGSRLCRPVMRSPETAQDIFYGNGAENRKWALTVQWIKALCLRVGVRVGMAGRSPTRARDSENVSPLFEACKTGDLASVKRLATPDNVNSRDLTGRKSTPLHFAAGKQKAR